MILSKRQRLQHAISTKERDLSKETVTLDVYGQIKIHKEIATEGYIK